MLLIMIAALVVLPQYLVAQNRSDAFDANCYFPELGNRSEIDSIYGSTHLQFLGSSPVLISPDGKQEQLLIGGLQESAFVVTSLDVRQGLDLHKLRVRKRGNLPRGTYQSGRFHKPDRIDLLYGDRTTAYRIFWADENGDYDSSRYTFLKTSLVGTGGRSTRLGKNVSLFYGRLTNDSLDDIVWEATTSGKLSENDTMYLMLYHGGDRLFSKGRVAVEDTSLFWSPVVVDTMGSGTGDRLIWSGDFRGTGRKAAVAMDHKANLFFLPNEAPFSLEQYAYHLRYDTLLSAWQNPNRKPRQSEMSDHAKPFALRALPKKYSDRSEDFFYPVPLYTEKHDAHYIFRGGSEFGSRRITYDDAEEVLHHPSFYDSRFNDLAAWGFEFDTVGDLTGTGNPVIYTTAQEGLATGHHFFYVLGTAIDDKADIFFTSSPFGWGKATPLRANNDRYGDVVVSLPEFMTLEDMDNNKRFVGSLALLYGSSRIPNRQNPKYAVNPKNGSSGPRISFGHGDITISGLDPSTRCDVEIRNVIGSTVYRLPIESDATGRISLPAMRLSSGVYFVIITPPNGFSPSVLTVQTIH